MSMDLSGYLDVFADEAREHLQALNDALLKFEKDPQDLDHVNVMFRSAHTLKGMSATMGFSEVAELTHKMENLLTPVRQGELAAGDAIIDVLFQCLDMLEKMVEAHINQEEHGIDVSGLVQTLEDLAEGKEVDPATAAEPAQVPAGDSAGEESTGAEADGYPAELPPEINSEITTARNNGKEVFHVTVRLEDNCELRNVRGFMVIKELKALGDLLHAVPEERVIVEENFGHTFDLLLSSNEPAEEIERAGLSVLEVDSVLVRPFGHTAAPAEEKPQRPVGSIFEFNDYDITLMKQAQADGFDVMHVHVQLSEDCTLKSARAFMVHKTLEETGEIINVVPSVEDIEFERFERDIDFLVLTKTGAETAEKGISSISEIDSVNINPSVALDQLRPGEHEPQATPEAATPTPPKAEEPAVKADQPAAPPAKAEDTKTPPAAMKKAPPKTPAKKSGKAAEKVRQTQTIRVDTERLDALLNLVGELVIGKTRLQQLSSEIRRPELIETIEHFDQIVFDLQNVVMQTRMVPIETVFNRFPRMIRDLAKQRGKQIELVMTGGETELDRTVIDEIGDPLVHLIRNSLDHGIETPEEREAAGKPAQGTLTLAAFHEGSNVFIEIKDDGKGIDPTIIRRKVVEKGLINEDQANQLTDQQAIQMIFAAGFSTAEQVTDISGRGVGMDVVRTKIEQLNGDIKLASEVGVGTDITIKLPLTLAIVQALLINIAEEVFAIPLAYIEATLRIWPDDIQKANQQDVYMYRGEILPLVWMRDLLSSPDVERKDDSWFVVVVQSGKQRLGLCVDNPIGQTEVVIKTLGEYLQNVEYIAGGTILGDGTVALILDVAHLAE